MFSRTLCEYEKFLLSPYFLVLWCEHRVFDTPRRLSPPTQPPTARVEPTDAAAASIAGVRIDPAPDLGGGGACLVRAPSAHRPVDVSPLATAAAAHPGPVARG